TGCRRTLRRSTTSSRCCGPTSRSRTWDSCERGKPLSPWPTHPRRTRTMKRFGLLLTALALACGALVAPDLRAQKAAPLPYVAVAPNALRKPVPEPELGLTEKYDAKVVRFTGAMRRWSQDKKAKTFTYELHHDIVRVTTVKGRKSAVREETI